MRTIYSVVILMFVFSLFCARSIAIQCDVNSLPDMQKIQHMLSDKNNLTWVFTGDSITQGAKHTYGMRDYTELFSERVRWEMLRKRDIVINTGMSGSTSEDLLSDIDWRVLRFKPDIVFLMIGTNDCTGGEVKTSIFRKNLTEIIKTIRRNNAILILNTPTPISSSCDPKRSSLPAYIQVIRDLSKEHNVVLIDQWLYWGKQYPNEDSKMSLLADAIHPNQFGHRMIANTIFKSLNIYDSNSPTCKFFIP